MIEHEKTSIKLSFAKSLNRSHFKCRQPFRKQNLRDPVSSAIGIFETVG
jgi:hypothetical protein